MYLFPVLRRLKTAATAIINALPPGFATLVLSTLALLLVSLHPPTASAQGDYDRDVVVVGGDANYPPYEFLDKEGKPAGFNVELTRAIAEVMGLNVEIRLGAWDRMRKALAEGEIDIVQGMAFSQERTAEVDFSNPHALLYQSIWTRKGNSRIHSLRDLHGKRVIVMRDSIMQEFMRRYDPSVQLILTDSLADALRLLNDGNYDCALVSKLTGKYLEKSLGLKRIVPVAKPLVRQEYGFAVKKGNAELLGRFNEGLAILKRSGQYQEIQRKWLGVLDPQPVTLQQLGRQVALVALPLLLVIGGIVLWSWTLRKQVGQRTEELAREVAEKERALEALRLQQDQLIQADKMASLGVLVAGVAHEINNPNALILLNLPLFEEAFRGSLPILDAWGEEHGDFRLGRHGYSRLRDQLPHMMSETQDAAKRIKRIVSELKDFARPDSADLSESIDLNSCVRAALRLVENPIVKSGQVLEVSLAERLPQLRGNAQRLQQVLVNLLLNASQAMREEGLRISVATEFDAAGSVVLCSVRDEGSGIASEHLPRLTDPFFTTKREEGGTGLGLSVSARIVKEHGGTLGFESGPGQGTEVTLSLPAARKEQGA